MNFLEENKIPLGGWISDFVDFLNLHSAWFFNFISTVLGFLIDGFIDLLQAVPALALIALLGVFAFWLHRSLWLAVGVVPIGRASRRERVCQYVWTSVVAVSLQK